MAKNALKILSYLQIKLSSLLEDSSIIWLIACSRIDVGSCTHPTFLEFTLPFIRKIYSKWLWSMVCEGSCDAKVIRFLPEYFYLLAFLRRTVSCIECGALEKKRKRKSNFQNRIKKLQKLGPKFCDSSILVPAIIRVLFFMEKKKSKLWAKQRICFWLYCCLMY